MSNTTKQTGVCKENNIWMFRCPKCTQETPATTREDARGSYKAHRVACKGTAPFTAGDGREPTTADKPKAVAKPKADKLKAKKERSGVCARVWAIADEVMKDKNATPSDVYAKCESEGIHPSTCRVQFGHYCREKFGQSPREKWGSPKQTVVRAKGQKPQVVLNPAADKNVSTISTARYKEGWKSTTLVIGGISEDVITSPDGVSYVRARANEKADILVNHKIKGLQNSRWRKLEDSAKSKRAAKTTEAKAERKSVKRKGPGK